jgi:hypothetical protein
LHEICLIPAHPTIPDAWSATWKLSVKRPIPEPQLGTESSEEEGFVPESVHSQQPKLAYDGGPCTRAARIESFHCYSLSFCSRRE